MSTELPASAAALYRATAKVCSRLHQASTSFEETDVQSSFASSSCFFFCRACLTASLLLAGTARTGRPASMSAMGGRSASNCDFPRSVLGVFGSFRGFILMRTNKAGSVTMRSIHPAASKALGPSLQCLRNALASTGRGWILRELCSLARPTAIAAPKM